MILSDAKLVEMKFYFSYASYSRKIRKGLYEGGLNVNINVQD